MKKSLRFWTHFSTPVIFYNPSVLMIVLSSLLLSFSECAAAVNWQRTLPPRSSWEGGVLPDAIDVDVNDEIIVLEPNELLHAYSAQGECLWNVTLESGWIHNVSDKGLICFSDKKIWVLATHGQGSGKIIMLDENHKPVKTFGSTVSTFCVSSDQKQILGIDHDGLFSLNAHGSLMWKLPKKLWGDSEIEFVNNLVIVPHFKGGTAALDPDTGAELWKVPLNVGFSYRPTPYGSDKILVPFSDRVSMYDTYGNEIWSYLPGPVGALTVKASPAVTPEGNVVVGTLTGQIVLLTPAGKKIWTLQLSNQIAAPISVGEDGTIYAIAGAHLCALNPKGIIYQDYFAPEIPSQDLKFDSAGHVILVAKDRTLYSLNPPSEETQTIAK